MKRFLSLGISGASLSSLVLPVLALAQTGQLPPPVLQNGPSGVLQLLCTIAGWMFTFLIVLAIIFVIYAAFKYLVGGGEPDKVSEANRALIYAAVAIAVAIIARSVPIIVGGLLGNTGAAGFAC